MGVCVCEKSRACEYILTILNLSNLSPLALYLSSSSRFVFFPFASPHTSRLLGRKIQIPWHKSKGNEAEGVEAMAAAEQLLQQEDDSSSEKQALSLAVAQAAASRVFDCSSKALKVLPGAAMASVGPVLQTVDVSKNALTNLLGQAPPSASSSEDGSDNWLSACSALKTLDASGNKLSAPLPFSLRTSPIATLKLDHNALTVASLAEVFGDTKSNSSRAAAAAESDYDPRLSFSPLGKSCTHLDLSTNRLNSIPSGVLDLRSLVHLNLAANALGASAAEAVPWPRLGACTSLDLSNNKIESLGSVPWMPQLQELRVCHNEIRRFPEELGANETLKSILLEGNPQRIINSEIVRIQGSSIRSFCVVTCQLYFFFSKFSCVM